MPRRKNAVFPGGYELACFSVGYILLNKCFFLFQNVSKCFKMSRCVSLSIISGVYVPARYKKLYQEKGFQPEKGCKVNFFLEKAKLFQRDTKIYTDQEKVQFFVPA
jgi:hypothetical protein